MGPEEETKECILPVQDMPTHSGAFTVHLGEKTHHQDNDCKDSVLKIFKCPVCSDVFKTRYNSDCSVFCHIVYLTIN